MYTAVVLALLSFIPLRASVTLHFSETPTTVAEAPETSVSSTTSTATETSSPTTATSEAEEKTTEEVPEYEEAYEEETDAAEEEVDAPVVETTTTKSSTIASEEKEGLLLKAKYEEETGEQRTYDDSGYYLRHRGTLIGWFNDIQHHVGKRLTPGTIVDVNAITNIPAEIQAKDCSISLIQMMSGKPETLKLFYIKHGENIPALPADYIQEAGYVGFGIDFENIMLPEWDDAEGFVKRGYTRYIYGEKKGRDMGPHRIKEGYKMYAKYCYKHIKSSEKKLGIKRKMKHRSGETMHFLHYRKNEIRGCFLSDDYDTEAEEGTVVNAKNLGYTLNPEFISNESQLKLLIARVKKNDSGYTYKPEYIPYGSTIPTAQENEELYQIAYGYGFDFENCMLPGETTGFNDEPFPALGFGYLSYTLYKSSPAHVSINIFHHMRIYESMQSTSTTPETKPETTKTKEHRSTWDKAKDGMKNFFTLQWHKL